MRFGVAPEALLAARFALSPLAELLGTLLDAQRLLEAGGEATPGIAEWLEESALHRDLLALLAHTKWLPDFVGLTPPREQDSSLEEELSQVCAWDESAFRRTLADSHEHAWIPLDDSWFSSHGLPERTAVALRSAWELVIASDWASRRAVLQREITHRSSLIARYGWAAAVADMGRRVSWDGAGALTISLGSDAHLSAGSHLCFVPTTHSRGIWTCDGPLGVALVYPARGTRAVDPTGRTGHLATLLGTGRAAVLLALDTPATPSQLHHVLGYALGTVGGHLNVLLASGLADRTRIRHEVYYSRTELGDRLLGLRP